ncbi:cytochrome P450 [Streptomyces sp. NPDC059564]|uniref:cytochrome P450 n=1 Tax=Streptomyces sp. NPDC059564 TaxID=3346865 RepID=UPI003686E7BC
MAASSAPTAPGRLPFLGHAHHLARQPLLFMESLREQGPLVRVFLGPTPTYVVTDPALTRKVLVTDAKDYPKGGSLIEGLRAFMGDGVGTIPDDQAHLSNRRLMQPMFNKAHIATRGEAMIRAARGLVGSWAEGVAQENVVDEMSELALRMFLAALFGADIPPHVQRELVRLVPLVFDGVGRYAVLPPWFTRLPLPVNTRHVRHMTRLRELIGEIIELNQGTNHVAPGCPHAASQEPGGLFSTLLTAHHPQTGPISQRQLQDELITLLAGAIETSAIGTSWTLFELIRHPEVQQRVREEITNVCGARPMRYEDLDHLPYSRRVLQEVIRLYGFGWLITRVTARTVTLGGHVLPEGATVGYSPYLLQRDPAVFPEPDRFDPERWTEERKTAAMRIAYVPFGAGRRNCIGENLAWAQLLITLGAIVQTWQQLDLVAPSPRPKATIVVVPDHFSIIPRRRTSPTQDLPDEMGG